MKPERITEAVLSWVNPAAFGRLCVETSRYTVIVVSRFPAAFGRLCVETVVVIDEAQNIFPAAFGRLCVETFMGYKLLTGLGQPPSGGCVLKQETRLWEGSRKGQPPSGGCVLKLVCLFCRRCRRSSRLRAAVC